MPIADQGVFRLSSRFLPVFLFLFFSSATLAQPTAAVSPSVVLVLKLVSETHVKPTTGIVISDTGMVLVSAEFAASQGEMIVLDGGTDIIKNGRPASVLPELGTDKLAVISVPGLTRPGITLSGNALDTDSSLHLEAFPPAENIAKGDPPLWVQLTLDAAAQETGLSVSSETPLPHVSGAIIDHCGYLAGVALSSGPQSVTNSKTPLTMFNTEVAGAFEAMELTVPTANCQRQIPTAGTPVVSGNKVEETALTDKPGEPTPATDEALAAEDDTSQAVLNDTGAATANTALIDNDDVVQDSIDADAKPPTSNQESRSIWRNVPLWLPAIGIIILGVLIWKAVFFFRIKTPAPGPGSTTRFTRDIQAASDEPVTAPLAEELNESVVKPRTAPVASFEIPALSERPDGCNGVLLIDGMLDVETGFKRFCFVNTEQFNITIGRGDTDIVIEHATISRSHVRIESDGESITISDLGSRNGTFIGDIPCLPGEIMYLDGSDEIYLGDVKFTIRVVEQEAEWA